MKVEMTKPIFAAVVAAVFVLGLFCGAFLKRFELAPLGEYNVMKIDKLTGRSWVRHGEGAQGNLSWSWHEVR